MIRCTVDKSRMYCKDTRTNKKQGYTRRTYACPKCRMRAVTIEMIVVMRRGKVAPGRGNKAMEGEANYYALVQKRLRTVAVAQVRTELKALLG